LLNGTKICAKKQAKMSDYRWGNGDRSSALGFVVSEFEGVTRLNAPAISSQLTKTIYDL
jgi:hypothetical protein